jgi:hypothetical protein
MLAFPSRPTLARAPGIPMLKRGPLLERFTLIPGSNFNDFLRDQPIAYPFVGQTFGQPLQFVVHLDVLERSQLWQTKLAQRFECHLALTDYFSNVCGDSHGSVGVHGRAEHSLRFTVPI